MSLALIAAVIAAALCLVLTPIVIRSGPRDRPGRRRAHSQITPTSGGVAVFAAAAAAVAGVLAFTAPEEIDPGLMTGLLALTGTMAALGALDDVFDLNAKLKLAVQIVAALLFSGFVARVDALPLWPGLTLDLPVWLAVPGSALWLVVCINAVNFVDGANGVAASVEVLSLAALGLMLMLGGEAPLAAAAFSASAAFAMFAAFNLQGQIFQGDAGALGAGALIGALGLIAPRLIGVGPYFAPLCLAPVLVDVFITLIRRTRGRRPLFQAHSEHLYQRWLASTSKPHTTLAWRFAILTALGCLAAIVDARISMGWRAVFAGGVFAAFMALWLWTHERIEALRGAM